MGDRQGGDKETGDRKAGDVVRGQQGPPKRAVYMLIKRRSYVRLMII